ncbi:hydrolase [Bacillus sp. 03113]|uniref:hydrolase n=1 Tax=Bacillus sp. 03113 TaxID=2578211 RepID=UPI001142DBAD|nr:hydrolase [Bacillus sp. 03113]
METRNFKLDTEWNMIHYPIKPKGFGVLIIGDERHFVDEKGSFWTQNEGKQSIVQELREKGYTIFYSNLYGRNWGCDKAVELAKQLYEYIIRTEIINHKIHLIGEGMGALVTLRLMNEMRPNIRSVVLINPVLSLKKHLEQERDHKFFYKKLLAELAFSYEIERNSIIEKLNNLEEMQIEAFGIPVKIVHVLTGSRSYRQSNVLNHLSVKWQDQKAPISVCYMVPEKKQQMGMQISSFIRKNEKVL